MKKKSLLFLIPAAAMVLAGCQNEVEQEQKQEEEQHEQEQKQDFVGVTLESSKEVYYDGETHSLTLSGVPEGATVVYEGAHEFTEVGTHHVKVTISKEGYNDLVLEGDLIIKAVEKIDFEGVSLETSKEIWYDGQEHSLELTGVPDGASVDYEGEHVFTEAGVHNVKVTISKEGYNDLILQGTLTIKALQHFEGVTLTGTTVAYDGEKHSISVVGAPEGASVEYLTEHEFVYPGEYLVKAKVTKEGFEQLDLQATLKIEGSAAQTAQVVDDFEGIGDSDLTSDWKLEYYNSGWVVPSSASISVANEQVIGEGSSSMKFNISHQGQAFKATKSMSPVMEKFTGISVDARADSAQENAKVKAQIQLWFKDLPLPAEYSGFKDTYATYLLSEDLSTNWTHFEIPFDDSSLRIAGDDQVTQAFKLLGYSVADFSYYIDKVAVLLTPNYVNGGPKAYAFVDNVKLDVGTSRVEQQHVSVAGRKYSVASTNGTIWNMSFDAENNVKFETANLESNITLTGKATAEGNAITIAVPVGASKSVNVPLTASFNGAKLSMGNPTGDIQELSSIFEHLAFNTPLEEVITIDNFESYSATGVGYDQSHAESAMTELRGAYHSDYYAGSGAKTSLIGDAQWQLMGSSDYLELESTNVHSGTKAANFKGSTNQMRFMNFALAKGNAQPFGRGQYLSMWVKSSVATTMNVRAWYVNKVSATNQGVTSGDAAYLAGAPVRTEWSQILLPLDALRYVYGYSINPAKAAARIYVDDVEIIGNANPYTEYVAPVVDQTIEDGKFGVVVGGEKAYSLEISNNVTTATFGEIGGETTAFTAEMANSKLTLKDTVAAGAGVTVVMDIDKDSLTVSSVTGAASEAFSGFMNGTLIKYESTSLDFQNEKADRDMTASTDPVWKQEKYNSGWVSAGTSMRVRHSDTNFYVNMATGYSMDYRYTYSPETIIGPANHISAKIANDFSGCSDIKVKVKVVKTNNSEVYVVGDASNYVTIPANTGNRAANEWYSLEADFDLCEVKSVVFILKSAKSGNDFLYVDDLAIGMKAATPEPPAAKTITDGRFYIWNGAEDCYLIDVSNSVSTGKLTKVGSSSMDATVSQSGGVLTVEVPDTLTIKATIGDNEQLTVSEVSGVAAQLFSASLLNKTAKKSAELNMDFSEGSGNGEYVNAKWTTQKYTTKWEDFDQNLAMNSKKDKNDNKIINLKAADSTTRTFTYTPDLPIGPVNQLDIDLGNYYTGGSQAAISYKIALLKADGSVAKYIAGDADNFASLAYDASNGSQLTKYSFPFALTCGYKLKITTKCSGTNYMYVDNLHLYCK